MERALVREDEVVRYRTLGGDDIPLGSSPPSIGGALVTRLRHDPQATLWRRFRDGTESEERLPVLLAEWTLAAIPEMEPEVARAKLEYATRAKTPGNAQERA